MQRLDLLKPARSVLNLAAPWSAETAALRERRPLHVRYGSITTGAPKQVVRPCPQCIQEQTCGAPAELQFEVSGVPVFSRYPLATSLNRRKVSM
jgi:hypothetical protein